MEAIKSGKGHLRGVGMAWANLKRWGGKTLAEVQLWLLGSGTVSEMREKLGLGQT